MPAKSRKKMKGQARKAKAKVAAAKSNTPVNNNNAPHQTNSFTIDDGTLITTPNNSIFCNHGTQVNKVPDVCS